MTFHIEIDISNQTLYVVKQNKRIKSYLISSSRYGVGEKKNSYQTPRGLHIIRAKIGTGCCPNTVFVGRRPTGEIFTLQHQMKYPDRDWILTRILWLSGLEIGKNRLNGVDTMQRYIYIHGTPDQVKMGVPQSHGCIRMTNKDIIALYELIPVQTRVLIKD